MPTAPSRRAHRWRSQRRPEPGATRSFRSAGKAIPKPMNAAKSGNAPVWCAFSPLPWSWVQDSWPVHRPEKWSAVFGKAGAKTNLDFAGNARHPERSEAEIRDPCRSAARRGSSSSRVKPGTMRRFRGKPGREPQSARSNCSSPAPPLRTSRPLTRSQLRVARRAVRKLRSKSLMPLSQARLVSASGPTAKPCWRSG